MNSKRILSKAESYPKKIMITEENNENVDNFDEVVHGQEETNSSPDIYHIIEFPWERELNIKNFQERIGNQYELEPEQNEQIFKDTDQEEFANSIRISMELVNMFN